MAIRSKNKNELLTLVGAVYSFVAYLTAFTLEVLFIIDLVKQNEYPYSRSGQILQSDTLVSSTGPLPLRSGASGPPPIVASLSPFEAAVEQARTGLESAHSYVTIPCLALAILYFITFIGSLTLITGLIMRSTFFLLIWICFMTTLCLPEFGLIVYVSTYAWGMDTRNGQTELLFYLLRAALNIIFIHRSYRLFRHWTDEKNFFRLKSSGSRFSNLCGYDSPYFIGDSLTTTINPVFSSSILNLDTATNQQDSPMYLRATTRDLTSTPDSVDNVYDMMQSKRPTTRLKERRDTSNVRDSQNTADSYGGRLSETSNEHDRNHQTQQHHHQQTSSSHSRSNLVRPRSIAAKYEFEMDLDYRTLSNQQHYQPEVENLNRDQRYEERITPFGSLRPGPTNLSYSTQSLDRRHLRDLDYTLPEQVILRPIGHQPFDYLQRLGSASNLASNSHLTLNTQPSGEQSRSQRSRYA